MADEMEKPRERHIDFRHAMARRLRIERIDEACGKGGQARADLGTGIVHAVPTGFTERGSDGSLAAHGDLRRRVQAGRNDLARIRQEQENTGDIKTTGLRKERFAIRRERVNPQRTIIAETLDFEISRREGNESVLDFREEDGLGCE